MFSQSFKFSLKKPILTNETYSLKYNDIGLLSYPITLVFTQGFSGQISLSHSPSLLKTVTK